MSSESVKSFRKGIVYLKLYFLVRIMLDEGIEIHGSSSTSSAVILFGDHKMDVLRILGNPNKEFFKGDSLFLNYLDLGLDVMIANDFKVAKFILHTNYPYHPNFCFYSRCFYELALKDKETITPLTKFPQI